ncbi:MAG TPA: type II toxin-antitoxin system VapC family toxin [Chthoniobacteraceae bacterium]|nr:type II toxin-antitoxin system VapC family toxin [Chthoniobacteraceae bacterium]
MIVVDTNLMAYRWLPGPRNADCDALVRLDAEWAAPLLWRSEFRNVLAGYMRAGKLSGTDAQLAMRHAAASLLGGEYAVADDVVLKLVGQSKCSAYDCEFVALAEALDTLLVTEDKALLAAFPKRCRSLTDAVQSGLKRP